MSLVFFSLGNAPISGLCGRSVGEGEEGDGEDSVGGGSPLSTLSKEGKEKELPTILVHISEQ